MHENLCEDKMIRKSYDRAVLVAHAAVVVDEEENGAHVCSKCRSFVF